MACQVPYCSREPKHPEKGDFLCAKHAKAWNKLGGGGDQFDLWLAEQADLLRDVCPTPEPLALEICDRLARLIDFTPVMGPRILEPSAGDGAFVRAARATWPTAEITAVEIREQPRSALLAAGATDVIIGDMKPATTVSCLEHDLIVGNPPFAVAEEHITHLLHFMKEGAFLAFILRVGFYGAKERLPFWSEHPEHFFAPITPRPGFKLNKKGKPGTDSQEYGLFIWQKGFMGAPTRLPHIVWENGKKRGGKRKVIEAPDLEVDAPELE